MKNLGPAFILGRMGIDNFGTWLEIKLSTLENNFKVISNLTGCLVMPVVKANAYGHGLERAAACLEKAGAKWFGVARIEEALALRAAGIQSNILVLGYTSPVRVPHALKENITLTVYDFSVAESYSKQAGALESPVNIHAKIDTGMGRLGIQDKFAENFISLLHKNKWLNLQGIFTHFARADEPEANTTKNQIERFGKIISNLQEAGICPEIIHAANSAGAIEFPESRFNMVRVGIGLYGLSPSKSVNLPPSIDPALSWKTRLISIKELEKGHGVSYGFSYYTKKKERIGVIAVGYGDGFRRQPGNKVLIRGKIADVVGNVCMDQSMVQIDHIPDAEIGDEVVLIGSQNGKEITATDIADRWNTINYEVICGLASRMPRYYLK